MKRHLVVPFVLAQLALVGCVGSAAQAAEIPRPATASSTRPMLWPVTTIAELREIQQGTIDGHQPWLCHAQSVVEAYARGPLGLADATVTRVRHGVYDVRTPRGRAATVTVFQPSGPGCGVWVVTAVTAYP